MARAKYRTHPLQLLFRTMKVFDEDGREVWMLDEEGMNELQDTGQVSDNAIEPRDVCLEDAERACIAAGAPWAISGWQKKMKKDVASMQALA